MVPFAVLDKLADHLTVLVGFSELMLDETYGWVPGNQREALESVLRAVRRAELILWGARGDAAA
jgi:hypothetical protein